jgi:hypothetical protein
MLAAIGLPPGGSSTVHIYTQTVHRTTQNKQCIVQHKIWEQYKNFVGKPQIKRRNGKIILKIYFKMGWNGVELSNMTQDKNKRRKIFNA